MKYSVIALAVLCSTIASAEPVRVEGLQLTIDMPYKVTQSHKKEKKQTRLNFATHTGDDSVEAFRQMQAHNDNIRNFGSFVISVEKRKSSARKEKRDLKSFLDNLSAKPKKLKNGWILTYEYGKAPDRFYGVKLRKKIGKRWVQCYTIAYSEKAQQTALAACESLTATK